MQLVYLVVALYLVLPYVGLYTVSEVHMNVYNLSEQSVFELRRAYLLYLVAFFLAFVTPIRLRINVGRRSFGRGLSTSQFLRLRRYISIFLFFAALLIFFIAGSGIFFGETHRGEIRMSFGGAGFLYKTLAQFWVPTALAVSGLLYRKAQLSGKFYAFPWLHLVMTILIMSMMGYKSGIIVGILPFLFITVAMVNLKWKISYAFLLIALLIYYSSFIMGIEDIALVAHYLFARATGGTAWGLIASWELFEHPHSRAWLSLTPVLGPRLTAALLNIPSNSVEYLMLGGGNYVTYLVHPDPAVVLAGETNLTITLAGEAIYLVGHSLFWLLALPVGAISGLLCSLLRFALLRDRLFLAPLLAVMVTNILLPLLNSGGLVSLFSVFNAFYMLATFIFLKLLYGAVGR